VSTELCISIGAKHLEIISANSINASLLCSTVLKETEYWGWLCGEERTKQAALQKPMTCIVLSSRLKMNEWDCGRYNAE